MLASASLVLLSSCARSDLTMGLNVINADMTYPETGITLSDGRTLTHQAREFGDENDELDGNSKAVSLYVLTDKNGQKLAECSSSLSDPKFCGEFESYNRKNDRICVMHSPSGHTILIIEDRSPNYPNQEHRLIQLMNGTPRAFKLHAERFRTESLHPLTNTFATVVGLSDTSVFYAHGEKHWSKPIEKLKRHDS